MIRWVAAIFLGLTIFPLLLPWLQKLGIGRVPGDVRFKLRGYIICLPFGSTLLISIVAFIAAELLQ
jgi:hypothetical protein